MLADEQSYGEGLFQHPQAIALTTRAALISNSGSIAAEMENAASGSVSKETLPRRPCSHFSRRIRGCGRGNSVALVRSDRGLRRWYRAEPGSDCRSASGRGRKVWG